MADCATLDPPHDKMTSDTMDRQSVSLFQDLKLKRKRVRDLLTDSETNRSMYLEGCESDHQSDISSGDSAYVSDRSSECGASAAGEEAPVKKKRMVNEAAACQQLSPTQLSPTQLSPTQLSPKGDREEKRWTASSEEGKSSAATLSTSSTAATTMTYMQGYLMPVSAGFPPMANMATSGLKFIPMMGVPAQGMFPTTLHNMPAPMFIAAPPNGYIFTSAESISTPAGPIIAYPRTDSSTHATASQPAGKVEEGEKKHLAPPSPKFKEPASEESRLEKDHEFITHYTNGKFVYTGHLVENPHNKGHLSSAEPTQDDSDGEDAMVCAICSDKATGLHYGIITCEGYVLVGGFCL